MLLTSASWSLRQGRASIDHQRGQCIAPPTRPRHLVVEVPPIRRLTKPITYNPRLRWFGPTSVGRWRDQALPYPPTELGAKVSNNLHRSLQLRRQPRKCGRHGQPGHC